MFGFQVQIISEFGARTVGKRISNDFLLTVCASSTQTRLAPSSDLMLSGLRSRPMNKITLLEATWTIARSVTRNSALRPRVRIRLSINSLEESQIEF